ncbi:MAG: GNAT family N-acetyltransferase [Ferruginibacter sp.]|nr:GNAT family N-acetyltransferase [Ferruginibacter sp.]
MISIVRTNSSNQDFRQLVQFLDKDLVVKDGDQHAFFAQFNKLDHINHVLLASMDNVAIGCGAIKEFDEQTAEVKRMFVLPAFRGRGIAGQLIQELERWAAELGYTNCILETGQKMTDAIRVYKKAGYTITGNYGQYIGVKESVCMNKIL